MRFARQLLSQHWSQAIILKGSMRGIGPTARTSGNFDKARHQLDINTRLPLAVNWLADLLVAKLSPNDFPFGEYGILRIRTSVPRPSGL